MGRKDCIHLRVRLLKKNTSFENTFGKPFHTLISVIIIIIGFLLYNDDWMIHAQPNKYYLVSQIKKNNKYYLFSRF